MPYKFRVEFIKTEIFEVEAMSADEAEDIAMEKLEADPYAFEGPCDKIITTRISTEFAPNYEVQQ